MTAGLAPVCRRRDLRASALLYVRGLLAPGVAGNCWSLAEAVGAEGGVLIFGETGQAKKGTMTAAAGRRYSGMMGRVENVIVAVYTTYATDRGHALIDRDLYVQEEWCAGTRRMVAAGFPGNHAFAAKSGLALTRARRALDAGIRPAWATGDEVYGRGREPRQLSGRRGIGYVFAVPVDHRVTTSGGVRLRARETLGLAEPGGWNRRSCGSGAKGPRYYDWAWIAAGHPRRQLLTGRSIADPSQIAYFCGYAPAGHLCSLAGLVKIAGTRWKAGG